MQKLLAVVKVVKEGHHYSNLLIGVENGEYLVWSNSSADQYTFEKTREVEIAAGVYNLWKKRYEKDGFKLEKYKDESMVVEGYENHDHPFLTV